MTNKSKLKVLFAAHSPHRGGAEYCLQTTLEHLDRDKFEAVVVFPDEGPMVDAARDLGWEVIIRPCSHWLYFNRNWWYWKNLLGRSIPNVMGLAKLIRDRGIDLVYTNTSAIFESALAAKRAKVPHVWHVHEVLQTGNHMQQLLPLRSIKRLIYRYSSRIVFESHASREVFEDCTPSDKSQVIHNSVRLNAEGVDSRDANRSAFGLEEPDVVVGYIGQFIDRKNPLLLIEALAELSNRDHVKCLFAGDGPLKDEMESRIRKYNLQGCCQLVEFQHDIRPFLSAIDVLALPSRQESFGLVLVEAGLFEKPVVACRSQGPEEIVNDGETGLLVAQDDRTAMAAALKEILKSASYRNRMGAKACERVNDLFNPNKNTRLLENVFKDTIQLVSSKSSLKPNEPHVRVGSH